MKTDTKGLLAQLRVPCLSQIQYFYWAFVADTQAIAEKRKEQFFVKPLTDNWPD